jgi:DNA-binding MurR/RpiR family transcriptional regulator
VEIVSSTIGTPTTPPPSSEGAWLGDVLPAITLTKAQARVVDVIVRNPQLCSYAELAEIAERADVNSSTVVRTAQSLGYRGWPDLQRELRARYLTMISSEETMDERGEHRDYRSRVHDALNHDIGNLRLTLEANLPEEVEATISALAAARSITIVALGSLAGPAMVMAHLGSTMGFPIMFESRGGVHLAATANNLGKGDVLVVLNIWRPMRQVIAVAEATRQSGATVVAITDMRRGSLSTTADHLLIVPSEGLSFFQSVTAATSVVYGLLAGMEAVHPERSRAALRRTQQLWKDLDIYMD